MIEIEGQLAEELHRAGYQMMRHWPVPGSGNEDRRTWLRAQIAVFRQGPRARADAILEYKRNPMRRSRRRARLERSGIPVLLVHKDTTPWTAAYRLTELLRNSRRNSARNLSSLYRAVPSSVPWYKHVAVTTIENKGHS